jgi:LmbE family N-acetylglucosaminyl deacetylase
MDVILASLLWSVVTLNAVELEHRLDRAQVLARVLYVAAHPDDENTQLLAYLTHARAARTAYLSLTRGDGGQNLIGREQSPLMGIIRTHELLAARGVDGAEQLFTRARDFGYDKRAEATLETWGHEVTLGDVVWAIRRFRPHVMITRFPEEGDTHGHHLASARLAREAFAAAGDPKRFPEQLDRVAPWQPLRLVFNVPNRFMPNEARPDDLVVDIGGYDAVSGLSHGEIAALSRSMHKSQGFGAARRFGPEPERFRHLAGARAERDLLEGIDTSWQSVAGGAAVGDALARAKAAFRPADPGAMAPELSKALEAARALEDARLRAWAEREITTLLVGSAGLMLEARAETPGVPPGSEVPVKVQLLRRGSAEARWRTLEAGAVVKVDEALPHHALVVREARVAVPADAQPSLFPWLRDPPGPGRERGDGDPDAPLPVPALTVVVELEIAGAPLRLTLPVRQFWVDPVQGERQRDVEVLPPLSLTAAGKAAVLPCRQGRCETKLRVAARARKPGTVRFEAPAGYEVEPAELAVDADRDIELVLRAAADAAPGVLRMSAVVDGRTWSLSEAPLAHDHIPLRTALLPAEVRLAPVELSVPEMPIAHIAGPGDEVADALRRVGFDLRDVDDEMLAHGDLDQFGAILVGIRAFNTREALRKNGARLFAFAERGGTVVVQYATKSRTEPLGVPVSPYMLEIGRNRVVDENAEVTFLAPDHPLLTTPHRLGAADFAGWVQERGLYFAEKWDEEKVTPLLAMADAGEAPERGALLVAPHGRGRVIYTGLALFRQLPAGVPGAYRLLGNLLARADAAPAAEEPPPLLGSWNKLYLVVLAFLVVLIAGFFLLTRRYAT